MKFAWFSHFACDPSWWLVGWWCTQAIEATLTQIIHLYRSQFNLNTDDETAQHPTDPYTTRLSSGRSGRQRRRLNVSAQNDQHPKRAKYLKIFLPSPLILGNISFLRTRPNGLRQLLLRQKFHPPPPQHGRTSFLSYSHSRQRAGKGQHQVRAKKRAIQVTTSTIVSPKTPPRFPRARHFAWLTPEKKELLNIKKTDFDVPKEN